MKQEAKLGVLGGMGPQATQVFYQFVLDRTDAAKDQDHLPALILSDTGIPDRTAAILSGDTEGLYRRLLADAKMLEGCGCTVLAIPCNTSHYFADRLQGEIGVPIIHMLRETAAALASQGKKRPGILGPDGRDKFAKIDRAIRKAGCDCAILACTELSVFATYHPLPSFYLDAMMVMAERAVERCGYPLRTI